MQAQEGVNTELLVALVLMLSGTRIGPSCEKGNS